LLRFELGRPGTKRQELPTGVAPLVPAKSTQSIHSFKPRQLNAELIGVRADAAPGPGRVGLLAGASTYAGIALDSQSDVRRVIERLQR
jgi:hypothetical protein